MILNARTFKLILSRALGLLLVFAGSIQADPIDLPATHCADSIGSNPQGISPPWGEEQITASRMLNQSYRAAKAPLWDADPMNIMLVLEAGTQRILVVDGASFKVLARIPASFSMYATPEIGTEGRNVFILSPGGWVQKYDIWSLKQVGCVRAGLNSARITLSGDGKWLAVANTQPASLVILSADDLSVGTVYEVTDDSGAPSRVSAVRSNPQRESFVMLLQDAPKIWEVFYGTNPPATGFVHDWRIEGPAPHSIRFPIRKITVLDRLDSFIFDPSYEYIIATTDQGDRHIVVDLVIGQIVGNF